MLVIYLLDRLVTFILVYCFSLFDNDTTTQNKVVVSSKRSFSCSRFNSKKSVIVDTKPGSARFCSS